MKTSEYSYRNSGKPASYSEESYAFANERYTDILQQAETSRRVKAQTAAAPAAKPARAAWQWVTAILTAIHLG